MDKFEKIIQKYKKRKMLSIWLIVGGCLIVALTILLIFVGSDEGIIPFWNQYLDWAVGLGCLCITAGAILFLSNIAALKDIEKTANRLNPDERQLIIVEKSKAKTLNFYMLVIFPVMFIASSILLMLELINFIAWIIIISTFMAVMIAYAVIRKIEERRF